MPRFGPEDKATKLTELLEHLQRNNPDEDWSLLSSFATVVYDGLPNWMARGMDVPDLSDRLRDNFLFFAKEIPPPSQLYRGLPGLQVVVRHSSEKESLRTTHGPAIPMATTIVETHTPDAPFIFDSLNNYFRKAGLRVFSAIHPILSVRRQWERVVWIGDVHQDGDKELLCRFRIQHIDSKEHLNRLQREIFSVLKCVFLALEDFQDMLSRVHEFVPAIRSRLDDDDWDLEPSQDFLRWLLDENFIFMGSVRYRFVDGVPERIPETSLGAFRDPALLPVVFPGLVEEVEKQLPPGPETKRIIEIDYCSNASAIYHLEPIDDVVIRRWGDDGSLEEATVLLGRFSEGSFAQKAADVPLLREKRQWFIDASGYAPMSYAFRRLRALFNRIPRRELFYAPVSQLKPFLDAIIQITGDDELAVHHRVARDYEVIYIAFSRFRYSYEVVNELSRAFSSTFGPVAFTTSEDAGPTQVLIFYFDTQDLDHSVDLSKVESITTQIITTWQDAVFIELTRALGEREGRRLFNRWVTRDTRSGIYREATPPEEVPFDVQRLDALESRLLVAVVPRGPERATLKIYTPKPLSFIETLATLKNLGLGVTEEMHIPITLPKRQTAHLYRYEIHEQPARIRALVEAETRLAKALRAMDEQRATDDSLNALILAGGLTWREVEILRTLRNHIQQVRTNYNQETVNRVLLRNARVARALHDAFEARFGLDDADNRAERIASASDGLMSSIDEVSRLFDDEILRAFANLISAIVRTNAYQRPQRPVFAMKVESSLVEAMPSPRPLYEIYVHSRLLEGIHLRGGRVARGGLRWSDRHDDFRDEVLGLMKTQMVKNSIIVPVGSKGGFVLKGKLPSRPALDAHLMERYREFISGLLDVTDNVVEGKVLHPPDVVRHDGDDAYLVVAADKGTAHLSDTANAVSKHYGFWLGDAFASGGSVGYDHKKVGITARGAWECIKHHFNNLGIDVMTQPFTVVAIGDMAGDVFGNGLLRSATTRLVAAFNHQHIFIDPNPDPATAFEERQRLFRLPRSSWLDYNQELVSEGGGVFERSAKRITITDPMRESLGIEDGASEISGEEMIRSILRAPIDLLYNGGIGTYVKSSNEEQVEVGDRANDRVRINADAVRAKVVGEGGNLGFTQRARLQYWEGGGSINTDAIDNSGGVDMSDHEVNIKILMNQLVKESKLQNRAERDRLFLEMTEAVAELVLEDNAQQSLALTLDNLRSRSRYEDFVKLLTNLITAQIMNVEDDDIPPWEETLSRSRERGFPRPLLALILGHVKASAYVEALKTDFPDSPQGVPFLEGYFPAALRERFSDAFADHPLRREIIATEAVNHVVNHAGVDFFDTMKQTTGAGMSEILEAYVDASIDRDAAEKRTAALGSAQTALEIHTQLLDIEEDLASTVKDKLVRRPTAETTVSSGTG